MDEGMFGKLAQNLDVVRAGEIDGFERGLKLTDGERFRHDAKAHQR